MKRIATLLLIILLLKTTSFSQDTLKITEKDSVVSITQNQLKETNLIFIEHSKLLKENGLLYRQLLNYKESDSILNRRDSIKTIMINDYESLSKIYNLKIGELNKEVRRKNKTVLVWKIGGITVTTALALWLLLK